MLAVLTCLTRDHDYRLVALAAAVCLIAAWTSLSAYRRALAANGALRAAMVALTAVAAGAGVWSTHFLAMLAYQPAMDIRYDFGLTAASLLVAWAGLSAGFSLPLLRAGSARPAAWRALGGAVVGVSIAAMHFTGVAAMRLPALLVWDKGLVAAAVAVAAAFAAAALTYGGALKTHRRMFGAAGLLVLAICGLHFTAMGAVTILPDASRQLAGEGLSRMNLALQVAFFVFLILAGAGAMVGLNRFGARTALGELRNALDGAPSAIAFFDSRYQLFFWNAPYAAVLGLYGLEAAAGLSLLTIMTEVGKRGLTNTNRQAGPEEVRAVGEVETPDGRWMLTDTSRSADGGLVVVMSDITEQRKAVIAAAAARDEAEAASRTKSEFVANMSHEIRTPLNAVLGMAQVMDRHPLSDEQRQRLDVIRGSGETLLGLLNNILDISKIESGRIDLESRPFDLGDLLAGACDGFAALAQEKGVRFRLDVVDGADGAWVGDAGRLTQIVSNLLSNALKFTPAGEVRLTVAPSRAGPEAGLTFAVSDTGIGLSPDQLDKVFDKFVQADASTTRRFGGTGLGLSICREIADLMGGRLWAESAPGQGSVFIAEIPLRRADGALPQPTLREAAAAPAADEQPLRILAAEDNPTNRLVLTALLEPLGAEVVLAADGREALDAFAAGRFDIVLMDVQMPGMNGIEAARAIRELEAGRRQAPTPILALTANVMNHQVAEYLEAGMDGHVAKPIHAESLFRAIDAALPALPENQAAA